MLWENKKLKLYKLNQKMKVLNTKIYSGNWLTTQQSGTSTIYIGGQIQSDRNLKRERERDNWIHMRNCILSYSNEESQTVIKLKNKHIGMKKKRLKEKYSSAHKIELGCSSHKGTCPPMANRSRPRTLSREPIQMKIEYEFWNQTKEKNYKI